MKSLYVTLICTIFILFELKSQNVLTEDFIFAPTDSLENLGDWYSSRINTAFNIKVVAPGLEYTGYAGSGVGNSVSVRISVLELPAKSVTKSHANLADL